MKNNDELRKEYIKENKEPIINYYKNTNDIIVLEGVLENLNSTDLVAPEIEEIKEVIINRLNELNNKTIKESINNAKKENINLDDFEIIETPKEINDKDNYGFRNDSYYLKVNDNGNIRIFEIDPSNLDTIKGIFNNKESLKDLSTKEILDKLLPYIKELEKINLDTKNNVDEYSINKEINSIYDNEVRIAFSNNMDEVLKERELLNEYMDKNGLLQVPLNYSLNRKGERIYLLGDKVIKFVGERKDMYFLSENGNELANNTNSNENNTENDSESTESDNEKKLENNEFNKNRTGNNENNTNIDNIPDNLNDLDTEFYINAINYTMDKIYKTETLTEYENKLIEIFLTLCVTSDEKDIPIALFEIYDTYYKYLYEYEDYYNETIESLFKPKIEQEKQREKEKKDNKSLTLENNTGFVNIIYIVCTIIIIVLGIMYVLLVKK